MPYLIMAYAQGTGAPVFQTSRNLNHGSLATGDYYGTHIDTTDSHTAIYATYDGTRGTIYIMNPATGATVQTIDLATVGLTTAMDSESMAINGTKLVVGDGNYNPGGSVNQGRAWVVNVTTGSVLQAIDNPNGFGTSEQDNFGWHCAISDSYIAVSAPYEDQATALSAGKTYVFNASTYALVTTIDNPDTTASAFNTGFGYRVALTDSYLAVTANNAVSGSTTSKIYVFNPATGALLQTLENPMTEYGQFGAHGMRISGSNLIVGARGADSGSGKAFVFDCSTGNLVHTFTNPNAAGTSANDTFGTAVDINDTYAIVGALGEDPGGLSEHGIAYLYNVSTGSLIQNLENPNISSYTDYDRFGCAVAISPNSNYIIVGAEAESAGGAAAEESGAAYVFDK